MIGGEVPPWFVSALLLAGITAPGADAAVVRVVNATGSIRARVVASPDLRVSRSSPERDTRASDVTVTRDAGAVVVACRPEDGARVDLALELPYGLALEARTGAGDITLSGMLRAELHTEQGGIEISAPWAATRLDLVSSQEPGVVRLPTGVKFLLKSSKEGWILQDRLPKRRVAFGRITVQAAAPRKLDLIDAAIPEDSPVKMHWQAPALLDAILSPSPPPAAGPAAPETSDAVLGEIPLFRSDVRLVNLAVAVFDAQGRPVTDLRAEDFEIRENRVLQQVTFASAEETPFNLALLLDLSGSTRRDRDAMRTAAERLLALARPQDRVAAYALAEDRFVILQRLTSDQQKVRAALARLAGASGGSPVYDTIVLAYAEELRKRAGERNALVVLTDGVDNQIQGEATPSEVSYRKLLRGAAIMETLIYPILLDPFTRVPPPAWALLAHQRMAELAAASGGRLFRAQSVQDLDPVYPQLAEELRSVYMVGYYPQDQQFDGRWRAVEVRVKRPGVRVRTRAGYLARPH